MAARYILARSKLAAGVSAVAGALRVQPGDGAKFTLDIGDWSYLQITDGRHVEIVRYNGTPITADLIPVQRAQQGTAGHVWTAGACVEVVLTEETLSDMIDQQCFLKLTDPAFPLPSTILRGDNVFEGVNSFLQPLTIGSTTFSPEALDSDRLLLNKGLYSQFDTDIPLDAVGYRSRVTRIGGSGDTYGAKFEAFAEDGTEPVTGMYAFAGSLISAASALVALDGVVRAQNSNNAQAKIGARVRFENRVSDSSSVVVGANLYNENSIGFLITSQARSTNGEFCGFARGIVFDENSLDKTTTRDAVGIDFADIPAAALAFIDSAIRLRANMGIEWNGDTAYYDSVRTHYANADNTFVLSTEGFERLKVEMYTGVPHFNDVGGTAGILQTNAAGAASGKYLTVFVKGVQYKLNLLNPS